jgi:hypothetical protein
MIARNDPSYDPIALLDEIADGRRRQRAHAVASTLITRQEGRGSPQCAQRGGVNRTIPRQHDEQTGPRVGSANASPHAAHAGASRTETRLSATTRSTTTAGGAAALRARRGFLAHFQALGVAPQAFERIELPRLRHEDVNDEREVVH